MFSRAVDDVAFPEETDTKQALLKKKKSLVKEKRKKEVVNGGLRVYPLHVRTRIHVIHSFVRERRLFPELSGWFVTFQALYWERGGAGAEATVDYF